MNKRRMLVATVMIVVLFGAGCEVVKIGDIKADPSKYRDKKVKVAGIVTTSFGVLQTGGYEIEDPTGKIFVISTAGVPARGSQVLVEGNVFTGGMVLGEAVGVAIRETKHEVK